MLRLAVIGAGHLGRIHAKLIEQTAGAELVAVCDFDAAAAARVAEPFGAQAVADYRGVMEQFDAAVVATPTGSHAAITSNLLAAGKHVLVEKPIADKAADAQRLAALATLHKRTLQVGHVERFNPAFLAAIDAFEENGTTGDIKFVEATRASRFPGRCLDVGVVMDLMIHDLDLVLSLTDAPVTSISGSGIAVVSDHEDVAECRVEFACGLIANLKASRVSPTPVREMTLSGRTGSATIDFGTPSLTTITASDVIAAGGFDLEAETDNPLQYADTLFDEHLLVDSRSLPPTNAILDELNDFVRAIKTATAPIVDGHAGARAVSVASDILDCFEERRWNASRRGIGAEVADRRAA